MTKETEESLRMMAQIVVNTVSYHIKERSDGITVDYILHYFQTAYEEGVRAGVKMIEVQPWEYTTSRQSVMELNEYSRNGWKPFKVIGPDRLNILWRRRKAVSNGEKTNATS